MSPVSVHDDSEPDEAESKERRLSGRRPAGSPRTEDGSGAERWVPVAVPDRGVVDDVDGNVRRGMLEGMREEAFGEGILAGSGAVKRQHPFRMETKVVPN
jgi:hypothetical protein